MAFRRLVPLSAKHPTQNEELFSALRDALPSTSRLYEDSDAYSHRSFSACKRTASPSAE